jgi:antitoxin PrlF
VTESTLTSKGQTTVPVAIRAALGARPGARLVWHLLPDGRIAVRLKSGSLLGLAGLLKRASQRRVSVQSLRAWR